MAFRWLGLSVFGLSYPFCQLFSELVAVSLLPVKQLHCGYFQSLKHWISLVGSAFISGWNACHLYFKANNICFCYEVMQGRVKLTAVFSDISPLSRRTLAAAQGINCSAREEHWTYFGDLLLLMDWCQFPGKVLDGQGLNCMMVHFRKRMLMLHQPVSAVTTDCPWDMLWKVVS